MPYTTITKPAEIKKVLAQLVSRVKQGAVCFKQHNIGWPNGHGAFDVYWHPKEKFWAMPEPSWYGYGIADPASNKSLSFTVQITPPMKFQGALPKGALLKDSAGMVWLAHSGHLTKGNASIGNDFVNHYDGSVVIVDWPNGKPRTLLLVACLDHKSFLDQLAQFVRRVAEYKQTLSDTKNKSEQLLAAGKLPLNTEFSPEFAGKMKPYDSHGQVSPENWHGFVINHLYGLLKTAGYSPAKSGAIDLYLLSKSGAMSHIFEAKTDTKTTHIYQAVGQLLLNAAPHPKCHRKILVVPQLPNSETEVALRSLGIVVLKYSWAGKTPKFKNLSEVLS